MPPPIQPLPLDRVLLWIATVLCCVIAMLTVLRLAADAHPEPADLELRGRPDQAARVVVQIPGCPEPLPEPDPESF